MSSNPYAHPGSYDDGSPDQPRRVSGLAVTSFVLSLICCIPGVSLFGAVLGGLAIVRISGARGRLGGRGLAIAGLVIGLLITLVWLGLAVGLARGLAEFETYGEVLEAVEQRDYNRVRQSLTPGAASIATDVRLEEFRLEIHAEWGAFQRMPRGIAEWISAYGQLGQRFGQQPMQPGQEFPMPVFYDNGMAVVVFVLDPAAGAGPQGAALSSNIGVFDQQGNTMWLVPPAVAAPAPPLPQAPPASPTEPPPTPPQEPTGEPGPG